GRSLVLPGAAAGDHLEPAQGRELAANLVGDPVGEVLVGGVAQVLEGEHGEEAGGAGTGGLDLAMGAEPAEQDAETEDESDPDEDGGAAVRRDAGRAVRRYGRGGAAGRGGDAGRGGGRGPDASLLQGPG